MQQQQSTTGSRGALTLINLGLNFRQGDAEDALYMRKLTADQHMCRCCGSMMLLILLLVFLFEIALHTF